MCTPRWRVFPVPLCNFYRQCVCVVDKVRATNAGCYLSSVYMSIILYADEIMLIAPSINALQCLMAVCEKELLYLDMHVNVKKSTCIRFGARYNAECACLSLAQGKPIQWSSHCRYLGVYFDNLYSPPSGRKKEEKNNNILPAGDPSSALLIAQNVSFSNL